MAKKVTRRMVIGTVAGAMESVANAFPFNPADIRQIAEAGRSARKELPHLASTLRVLEDDGVESAWEYLDEKYKPTTTAKDT